MCYHINIGLFVILIQALRKQYTQEDCVLKTSSIRKFTFKDPESAYIEGQILNKDELKRESGWLDVDLVFGDPDGVQVQPSFYESMIRSIFDSHCSPM